MSDTRTDLSEYESIAKTVQHYIDGAKSGRGADMQPAFHQEATIFGYADGELFAGPIQLLFDYVDHDAPATGLHARIVGIDIVDTIAGVRLELADWNGHCYGRGLGGRGPSGPRGSSPAGTAASSTGSPCTGSAGRPSGGVRSFFLRSLATSLKRFFSTI